MIERLVAKLVRELSRRGNGRRRIDLRNAVRLCTRAVSYDKQDNNHDDDLVPGSENNNNNIAKAKSTWSFKVGYIEVYNEKLSKIFSFFVEFTKTINNK